MLFRSKPVIDKILAPIINGSKDGITLLNQSKSPFFAEVIMSLGNNIIRILKNITTIGII